MEKKIKCEEWKYISGYTGLYQVSDRGRIRSISRYVANNRNGGVRWSAGRVLKQYKMPNGYYQVQLSKGKKKEKKYVHRIVAIAFLPNKNGLTDVNHVDGDKGNNSVENLEWCDHKSNQIHMVKNGLTKKAYPVICVETQKIYSSMSEAERMTGAERHSIKKSCETGEAYKGYHWERINEWKSKM